MTRAALAALVAVVALAGCDDAATPARPVALPDAGPGVSMSCADEAAVVAQVLRPRCADADCHDADEPKAELDLVSPGVSARVVAARSIHDACRDRAIVVPGVPQASFLFDKVLATEGECGDPMPLDSSLTLDERRCLAEWIGAM